MSVSYPCESEYTNDEIHVPYIAKNYSTFNCEISDVLEEKIDYSQLEPCLKEVMDELKNSTNNDIKSILEKLSAGNVYKVEIKMGTMVKANDYAETQPISKNNYLITFTQDTYINATKLYKATVLLHELIHAEMLSIVDDYNTYPTSDPFNGLPELFKLYVEMKKMDPVVSQHEDMANRYVNAIASSLEQYQTKINFPIFISDKQIFIDLAWSGLQGTDMYNKKYPIGSANRKRLENTIIAESIGTSYYGTNVTGSPCN